MRRDHAQFSFITPNLCDDGHDSPCVDGRAGGLTQINVFLKQWILLILDSPAYKKDGLLIVTFDEAEFESTSSDSSACCGEIPGPNSPVPGIAGPGGGRIGAVVLWPFIKPGTVITTDANHYGLLRAVEDIFGLIHLGFAAQSSDSPFVVVFFSQKP
jgi:phosphatidylinositol-3-phosphatase